MAIKEMRVAQKLFDKENQFVLFEIKSCFINSFPFHLLILKNLNPLIFNILHKSFNPFSSPP